MAQAVVTMKLMPGGPDVDLESLQSTVQEKIEAFTQDTSEKRFSLEPVAFGLKALQIIFVMNEDIGSTEDLEADLATLEGVQSVDVTDVRRTLG
ncbi:MAG: elongation factor 1-beta [Candidatus Woesearchaeota archaeon]|nr:elongation factor 1-beta [Candidatus Woesearchaeota archaeon]